LRALELCNQSGSLALRDPFDGRLFPLDVREALVVAHLNGVFSAPQIALAVGDRLDAAIAEDEVVGLLQRLSAAGLLDDATGRAREREARRVLERSPVREPAHSGAVYPADAQRCREFFDELLESSTPQPLPGEQPLAVISPHVDYARGRAVYGALWATLDELAPSIDRLVVLGTSHAGGESPLVLTRKAFQTPLGRIESDAEVVGELIDRCGEPSLQDELLHRWEHSIELQLPLLQRALSLSEVPIVPILCGTIHKAIYDRRRPETQEPISEALGHAKEVFDAAGGRTLWVAGVDLAHVGMHFGDPPEPLSDDDLERVRVRDHQLLDTVLAGDAQGLSDHLLEDGDARRICGFAPIWLLLNLAGPLRGRLLSYGQTVDPARAQAVSFAGALFSPDPRATSG